MSRSVTGRGNFLLLHHCAIFALQSNNQEEIKLIRKHWKIGHAPFPVFRSKKYQESTTAPEISDCRICWMFFSYRWFLFFPLLFYSGDHQSKLPSFSPIRMTALPQKLSPIPLCFSTQKSEVNGNVWKIDFLNLGHFSRHFVAMSLQPMSEIKPLQPRYEWEKLLIRWFLLPLPLPLRLFGVPHPPLDPPAPGVLFSNSRFFSTRGECIFTNSAPRAFSTLIRSFSIFDFPPQGIVNLWFPPSSHSQPFKIWVVAPTKGHCQLFSLPGHSQP